MYPISKKGIKKVKRKIKEKKYHRPLYIMYLQRAAIIVLATISIISGVFITSEKVRAAVKDTVIEWYDKYIKFDFSQKNLDNADTSNDNPVNIESLKIEYIPEGFELQAKDEVSQHREYNYFDSYGNYVIIGIHESSATELLSDIEYSQLKETTINGFSAYVLVNDSDAYTTVIFGNESFAVMVDTAISKEETIKIAENIK